MRKMKRGKAYLVEKGDTVTGQAMEKQQQICLKTMSNDSEAFRKLDGYTCQVFLQCTW